MAKRKRNHKARNVVAAVLNEIWAMHEPRLQQIVGFLELRADGAEVSEETIAEVMQQQMADTFYGQLAAEHNHEGGPLIVNGVQAMPLMGTLAPRMNLMMRFSGGTSTQNFASAVRQAADNADVHTLFVEGDTPGGAVAGTEEAYRAVEYFRSKGKRAIIVGRNLVASAGYYVASAFDRVISTPSTEWGSVGVYAILENDSEYYAKNGIKFGVFRAGQVKAAGNPYEKWTDAQVAAIQARIDAPYAAFVNSLAKGRGVDAKTVLDTYGQGTVFLAEEALQRGMIDEIVDSIDEAWAMVAGTSATSSNNSNLNPFAKECDMNPRIKAALMAKGLISSMEAGDDVCQSAINAFFAGRGQSAPQGDDAILAALMTQQASSASAETGTETPVAANVQAAKDREMAEARQAAVQASEELRARVAALRTTGLQISDDQLTAAIRGLSDGTHASVDAAVGHLINTPPATQQQADSERGLTRIAPTGSEIDNFQAAAIDGLLMRHGRPVQQPAAGAREIAGRRMIDIVRRDMQIRGIESRHMDDEAAANVWLNQGGHQFFTLGADASIASPSDYPNLLSGLLRRTLDDSMVLKATNYRRWTAMHPSVNDLHAHTVMAAGELGLLEDIDDDDKTPEDQIAEALLAWFQVKRKGKKVALTAVMVAQDQLGVFMDNFGRLRIAEDLTIQDLAINVLVNNGALLDGTALFHADHGNLIAAGNGGVPSDAEASDMRKLMERQTNVGDGRHFVSLTPKIVIVPTELHDAARRTYSPLSELMEVKAPATDATINVNRGTVDDIISLPELEAKDSTNGTKYWYTLADPMLAAAIKIVHQRGFESGRTDTWFDADRQTRYFRLETRVAAFANHYRGICRNDGQ